MVRDAGADARVTRVSRRDRPAVVVPRQPGRGGARAIRSRRATETFSRREAAHTLPPAP